MDKFLHRPTEEIIEDLEKETPAAEQFLIELARELGYKEVVLFSGETKAIS